MPQESWNTRSNNVNTAKNTSKKGESHRIYWQQWLASDGNDHHHQPSSNHQHSSHHTTTCSPKSPRQQLITSSAAVRIAPTGEARAQDITDLLRETLRISSSSTNTSAAAAGATAASESRTDEHDSLVLVGTLYSLPGDCIQYEHELPQQKDALTMVPVTHLTANGGGDDPTRTVTTWDGNQTNGSRQSTTTTTATSIKPSCQSDPFHVVRTLAPNENPLHVRDLMEQHLRRLEQQSQAVLSGIPFTIGGSNTATPVVNRTIIPPKIQWYYVPAISNSSACSIPNCIDLDGYCTSMEEQHDDDDVDEGGYWYEDDGESNAQLKKEGMMMWDDHAESVQQSGVERFPWLSIEGEQEEERAENNDNLNAACISSPQRKPLLDAHDQLIYTRETKRYYALLQCQSTSRPAQLLSGFLLKRSRRDPHVWRRVHCILTYDHLWFVSRLYPFPEQSDDNPAFCPQATNHSTHPQRYAKHGRIKLTHALLLEPAADYAPLYRTPYSFEVVSASGTSHVFRATNKQLQIRWIQALSDLIVESYENSLLQTAELLTADESTARSRRMASVSAESLWQACVDQSNAVTMDGVDSNDDGERDDLRPAPSVAQLLKSRHVGSILRWSIEVAEYRECCRYIHSRLPPKSPVVVKSSLVSGERTRQTSSSSLHDSSEYLMPSPLSLPIVPEPIDPVIQSMIRSTWEQASALLARATHVALQVYPKLSRSVETSCRHVDYIITGRFRSFSADAADFTASTSAISHPPLSEHSNNGEAPHHHHHDPKSGPPPFDLFDHLLGELQTLAANAVVTEQIASPTDDETINGGY